MSTLWIERLRHRGELRELHALAKAAFGEDAMPLQLIEQLHWEGREGTFLLVDAAGAVLGYIAAFFLRRRCWASLIAGTSDPLEWQARDLVVNDWALEGSGGLYLESMYVRPEFRPHGSLYLVHMLQSWIAAGLALPGAAAEVPCASLAASDAGARLLRKRFGLEYAMPAKDRRDDMDLYRGQLRT